MFVNVGLKMNFWKKELSKSEKTSNCLLLSRQICVMTSTYLAHKRTKLTRGLSDGKKLFSYEDMKILTRIKDYTMEKW